MIIQENRGKTGLWMLIVNPEEYFGPKVLCGFTYPLNFSIQRFMHINTAAFGIFWIGLQTRPCLAHCPQTYSIPVHYYLTPMPSVGLRI